MEDQTSSTQQTSSSIPAANAEPIREFIRVDTSSNGMENKGSDVGQPLETKAAKDRG